MITRRRLDPLQVLRATAGPLSIAALYMVAVVLYEQEAEAPLAFALNTAETLDSPEGRTRAGYALGQMHEQLGDREAAIKAYEAMLAAAREIDRTTFIERAEIALGRLLEARPGEPDES